VVVSIFGGLWTILEATGVKGSASLAFGLFGVAIVSVLVFRIVTFAFRWSILFAAVKEYVRDRLIGTVIKPETVLISAGGGGAICLGMVSKALQGMGHPVPRCLVVDQEYRVGESVKLGTLLPPDFDLRTQDVLIVITYVGTGQTLRGLRERLGIPNAPVFSFVVSESATEREQVEHFLIVGHRAVIPWPRAKPNP